MAASLPPFAPNRLAPPPWLLTGEGTVLVYHFPPQFVSQYGFLADYQQRGYQGWIGAVMLVEYRSSGVGPYQELIFLPGLFTLGGKLSFSISKIFVSTYDSVWNGIRNWGIPKEQADFFLLKKSDGTRLLTVEQDSRLILEARVAPWGPRLPLSTKFLPPLRVVQQLQDRLLLTRLSVSGQAQLASLQHAVADPAYFPPLHLLRPLAAFCLHDFRMIFPVPEVL